MTPLTLSAGTALSDRYEIECEIGAGAASVVYRARDRKHDRPVAVKVLRPEFTGGSTSLRFRREIAIAARLHHPHILPLFDSGEAEGLTYFTMPYVEGETLREALRRSGRLPVAEAMAIARQVASALSYAHAQGILHRDVKPENIMMAEGVPELADFGVAYAVTSEIDEPITEHGTVVGTVHYMSPEQWDDGQAVDERSDLYGLGCVLYEMIAGAPPFTGPTRQMIVARHAMEPIPRLAETDPSVPMRLDDALQRALAKTPSERFASLAEFAAELAEIDVEERMTAGAAAHRHTRRRTGRDRPGILVLPFAQLSSSEDEELVAAGLADEIITSLSGLEVLRVISHTSAAQLRGTARSAKDLGDQLNVTYVLEGSVRDFGDTLRVGTRLVATDSEELVWGHSYEGRLSDLLEFEKSITAAVVDALEVRVSQRERRKLTEPRISDARAYEYYVRARQEVYKFKQDALERALDYLRKGLDLCGDNVAIWAAMGQVYWQHINAGISANTEYFEKARACADKILEIDPESAEARRLLGLLEISASGNPQVAVDHLKAALDASPDDPESLFWLALILGFAGRPSTGYALAIRLLEIDPLTPLHYVVPGFLDVLDGDAERGVPWLQRAHDLERGNPITAIALGQALAMTGRVDDGAKVLEGIETHVPGSFFAQFGCVMAHAIQSRAAEAREALTPDVIENARQDLQYSWTLAQCLALMGDVEDACRWLKNAVEQGFWNYPLFAERDPLLEPLRDVPAFADVVATTKAKWLDFRA